MAAVKRSGESNPAEGGGDGGAIGAGRVLAMILYGLDMNALP